MGKFRISFFRKLFFIFTLAIPVSFLFSFAQAMQVAPRYFYKNYVCFNGIPACSVTYKTPDEAFAGLKRDLAATGSPYITLLDLFPQPGGAVLNGKPETFWWHQSDTRDGPGEISTGGIGLNTECPKGMIYVENVYQTTPPTIDFYCTDEQYSVNPDPALKKNNDKCDCTNLAASAPTVGNPIYPSSGIKYETEVDYLGADDLTISRTYRSDRKKWAISTGMTAFGLGNSNSNTDVFLAIDSIKSPPCQYGIGDATGEPYCFPILVNNWNIPTSSGFFMIERNNGQRFNFGDGKSLLPTSDINDRVTKTLGENGNLIGWEIYNSEDDSVEKYNNSSQILEKKSRSGRLTSFRYSDASTPITIAPNPGLLIAMSDQFGRQVGFIYDSNERLIGMTDPNGGSYVYAYDEASSFVIPGNQASGNLTSVTYPDGKRKVYWYNEQDKTANINLPFALTGITDENGNRFASFIYNSNGVAVSTFHANGVDNYDVSYPSLFTTGVVTDPLGSIWTYNFKTIFGTLKSTGISGPNINGINSLSSALSYDSQGNVSSSIDFNGVTNTYTYDLTRNLETSRVEAFGTPTARTTTTTWHSTYRLPLQIAEPKRITTFAYDANGNLLSKSVQATTDATGASGLSATTTGPARTWSYTYTSLGQMLTATGPTKDVTSYSYDDHGNLTSVTNAAGHVTNLSNYDPNGRVGRITDPNGLITDLTYTPRGWLSSRTVGGQVTNFGYDGVGQLTQVTFPDTSTINYVYDDAHRLTSVADSLGNSIAYTLDNMGNRTGETVVDPTGVLARQTNRVYDALNRLQQQTGNVH